MGTFDKSNQNIVLYINAEATLSNDFGIKLVKLDDFHVQITKRKMELYFPTQNSVQQCLFIEMKIGDIGIQFKNNQRETGTPIPRPKFSTLFIH